MNSPRTGNAGWPASRPPPSPWWRSGPAPPPPSRPRGLGLLLRPGDGGAALEERGDLRSLDLLRGFEPGAYVERIAPTPLLCIAARSDTASPSTSSSPPTSAPARPSGCSSSPAATSRSIRPGSTPRPGPPATGSRAPGAGAAAGGVRLRGGEKNRPATSRAFVETSPAAVRTSPEPPPSGRLRRPRTPEISAALETPRRRGNGKDFDSARGVSTEISACDPLFHRFSGPGRRHLPQRPGVARREAPGREVGEPAGDSIVAAGGSVPTPGPPRTPGRRSPGRRAPRRGSPGSSRAASGWSSRQRGASCRRVRGPGRPFPPARGRRDRRSGPSGRG